MGKISIIAAIGKNNELGFNNDLIWHFKEDMKFFKENTMGKPIVMGMNTLRSLPKLLEGRKHLVLTRQNIQIDGVEIYHDIESVLNYINSLDTETMVIGGASIYKQFINYADSMLLTEIDASAEADVFFPSFNKDEWESEIISEIHDYKIPYKHMKYTRK